MRSTTPADSPWKGHVWSFTTADFLVIDDFEAYTDEEGSRIYETWIDGYTDRQRLRRRLPPGPVCRADDRPRRPPVDAAWTTTTSSRPFYSEAERELAQAAGLDGQRRQYADALRPRPRRPTAPAAVRRPGGQRRASSPSSTHPDPAVLTTAKWTEWKIPLSSFTGVNPAKVKKLYIGVGDRTDPKASIFGRLYLDDIRVVKPY